MWPVAATSCFRRESTGPAGPTAGVLPRLTRACGERTRRTGYPVKKVILKRTSGGTVLLKALVKGSIGTQSLDVVPPNPGDDGGIILTINGGGTYCAAFAAGAGGTERADTP